MVVIKLLTTGPVVSWGEWETIPPGTVAQLSFFAQAPLGEDLRCGVLPSFSSVCGFVVVDVLVFPSTQQIEYFQSFLFVS